MRFTTIATSKGQLTIPKEIREKLNLKAGVKVDIYPTTDGTGFIGRLQRKSRIMEFAGDLQHLNDGKSLQEIKEVTQKKAAETIVKRLEKTISK